MSPSDFIDKYSEATLDKDAPIFTEVCFDEDGIREFERLVTDEIRQRSRASQLEVLRSHINHLVRDDDIDYTIMNLHIHN